MNILFFLFWTQFHCFYLKRQLNQQSKYMYVTSPQDRWIHICATNALFKRKWHDKIGRAFRNNIFYKIKIDIFFQDDVSWRTSDEQHLSSSFGRLSFSIRNTLEPDTGRSWYPSNSSIIPPSCDPLSFTCQINLMFITAKQTSLMK